MGILAAALLAMSGQSAPPAPPVAIDTAPRLIEYQAGIAVCGDRVEPWILSNPPFPSAQTGERAGRAIRLSFAIDEAGRPHRISSGPWSESPERDSRDVKPAFATWRFAPGSARSDCSIDFVSRAVAVKDADTGLLGRYVALATPSAPGWNDRIRRDAFLRLGGGAECADREPEPRRQVYPAFERIRFAQGAPAFSVHIFDVDADGRPVRQRLLASSGNAEFDQASKRAVIQSRFAPQQRQGCIRYMWGHDRTPVKAPPLPELSAYRTEDANCPAAVEDSWAIPLRLEFPEPYRRRFIEGAAIVRYDVSSWGAIGRVKVLASEPTDAFGQQARRMIETSRKAESDRGYQGCLAHVLFKMPATSTP